MATTTVLITHSDQRFSFPYVSTLPRHWFPVQFLPYCAFSSTPPNSRTRRSNLVMDQYICDCLMACALLARWWRVESFWKWIGHAFSWIFADRSGIIWKQWTHYLLLQGKIKVLHSKTAWASPRQKYFKYKLQLRSTYHMILDQNESTKIFFSHFGRLN